jgi:exopolysaccharide production protein ExoZ
MTQFKGVQGGKSVGSNKYLWVQYLRGAAALMVVFAHTMGNWVTQFKPELNPAWVDLPGEVGVYIFFVISGFIIQRTAPVKSGRTSALDFLRRRLIRIVPMYWIFTSLYAAKLMAQHKAVLPMDFLKSILFIPYLNAVGQMRPVHQLGWTLNFEMYFYAAFAAGIIFTTGFRRTLLVAAPICWR